MNYSGSKGLPPPLLLEDDNNCDADDDPLDAKRHGGTNGSRTTAGSGPITISNLLWEGAALTKIPFHTVGPAQRRYLRLRRIDEEEVGVGCNATDDGSSYAFRTPPSIKKKRRKQIHSGGASSGRIGRLNANKYNSVEICVSTPGQPSKGVINGNILQLAAKPLCLEWFDPDNPSMVDGTDTSSTGRQRSINLDDIRDVTTGHATPAFRAYRIRHQQHQHLSDADGRSSCGDVRLPDASLCFSIVTHQRTLDLAADSVHEARRWVAALHSLVEQYEAWGGGKGMSNITPKHRSSRRQRIASPISRLASSPVLNDSFTSVASNVATSWDAMHNDKVFYAARAGNVDSLATCFDQDGCPVDIMEQSSGDTPLLLACRLGHADVVDLCLKRGAHNDPHPTYGQTALQAAVSSGNTSCGKLLLETAAKSGADSIIANHEEICATDPTRREAPIHTAARCGSLAIVELLVLHGANLGLVDSSGRTALHSAAAAGHSAILKFLLDASGDVFIEQMNDCGMTCLHLAVQNNKLDCVRALLEFAADADERAMEMATARRLGKIAALLQAYCAVNAVRSPGADHGPLVKCQDDDAASRRSSISTVTFDLPRPEPSGSASSYASRAECLQKAMGGHTGGIENDGGSVRRVVTRRSTIGHTPAHHHTPSHYFTPASTPFDQHREEQRTLCQPQCAGGWASPGPMLQPPAMTLSVPAMTPSVPATLSVIEAFQLGVQYWQTYHEPGTNRLFFVRHSDGHSQWKDPRLPPISSMSGIDAAVPSMKTASHHEIFRTPLSSPEIIAQGTLCSPVVSCQQRSSRFDSIELPGDNGRALADENDPGGETIASASGGQNHSKSDDLESSPADQRKAMATMIRSSANMQEDDAEGNSNSPSDKEKSTKTDAEKDSRDAMLSMIRSRNNQAAGSAACETNVDTQREAATSAVKEEPQDPRKVMLSMIRAQSVAPTAQSSDTKDIEHKETRPDPRKAMLAMIKARAPPTAETGDSGSFTVVGGKLSSSANESDSEAGDDMSDEEKKAIDKYKRMLRMQVPEEAVRHEMRKQGHDAQPAVFAVFGSPDGNDEIIRTDKPASCDSASSGATAAPTKEGAAKDPVLAPYAKMVKVGVPVLSALHKLTKEGVEEDKILYFKRAYGINDGISAIATKKRKTVSSPPASSSVPTPSTKRPSKALQRIHWTTVTDVTKLEGSLWAADVDGGCGGEALDDSAIRELEEVFADAPASSVGMATPATQRKTKRQIVSLIDPRRAQNIAIQLAQFKSFASDDELLSSLSAMTAEHLLILTSILPTADEVAIVAAYEDNLSCLGRAEQFFVAVSKVPRLPSRLRAFLFMSEFNAMASELESCLDSVSRACDEVVDSAQLKSLLRRLLVVGNTMNVSTGQKRAGGISVDSIIKTATKRGRDNKTTVADHVVANLLKQGDADGVVEFASSIRGIENGKDVDMRDVEATLRKMEADLAQLRKTIDSEHGEELKNGTSDLIEKGTTFVGHTSSRIEVLKAKLNAAQQNTLARR